MGGGGGIGGAIGGILGGDAGVGSAEAGVGYAKQAAEWAEKNVGLADDFAGQLQGTSDQFTQLGQDKLDNYESYFGGIEANLAGYYKNLDPVKYAQTNKTNYATELNKQMDQYTDTMASRGLMSSGMRNQAGKEQAFQQAQGNAQIDLAAEDQVRGMQQGWLGRGDQQEQIATGYMKDSANLLNMGYGAQSSANTGVANAWNGVANAQQNVAGVESSAYGSNLGLVGGLAGAGAMASLSDIRLKTNIKQVDVVHNINVYTWDWKDESRTEPTRGVIAQEIMYEYPEAIIENEDGYLAVDYALLPEGIM